MTRSMIVWLFICISPVVNWQPVQSVYVFLLGVFVCFYMLSTGVVMEGCCLEWNYLF